MLVEVDRSPTRPCLCSDPSSDRPVRRRQRARTPCWGASPSRGPHAGHLQPSYEVLAAHGAKHLPPPEPLALCASRILPNPAVLESRRCRCAAPRPALPAPGSALGGPPGAPAPSLSLGGRGDHIGSSRHARLVQHEAIFLAFDCPAHGRRLKAAFGVASAIGYAEP